jgi:hypothetical protein
MFYLRWINPIVAVVILLICSWLYFGGYFCSVPRYFVVTGIVL